MVLHKAIDTTDIKGVIDEHWEELRMLTSGDEGFDKVGRAPPFYRGRLLLVFSILSVV